MFSQIQVVLSRLDTAEVWREENQHLLTRLGELERLRAIDLKTIAGLEKDLRTLRVCNAALGVDAERRTREIGILMSRNAILEREYTQLFAFTSAQKERSALGAIELESCRRFIAQQKSELDAVIQSQSVMEEKLVQLEASCVFHAKQWGALEELLQCPIGLEVMQSPVIVSTGQCYERTYIVDWLSGRIGSETCPVTKGRLTVIGSEFVQSAFVLKDVCELVSQTLQSIKDPHGLTHVETAVM